MMKRKNKRNSKPQAVRSFSVSDAESECDNSPNRFKNDPNCNIERSSTPYSKPSTSLSSDYICSYIKNELSFEDSRLEDSQLENDGPSFGNFSSFLKSYGLDSEDEELPTVSRLVENRRDTSMYQISHIQKNESIESTNFQNLSVDTPRDIRVVSVTSKQLEIVLLQHPASLTLHGYIKVFVLVGTASILGYDVKEGNFVHVLSSKNTGFKKVVTQNSIHKSTKARYRKKLMKIVDVEDKDDLPDFLDHIGPGTVIIVLQKSLRPPQLDFLELYFPRALEINWATKNKKTSLCSTEESNTITINDEYEHIAKQVNELIYKSVSGDAEFGTRVIMHGPKQAGKSSLLRYLINTLLNTYPAVYYLDVDPGQTEFTPPGVVSLVKVARPIFGPPFCHRRKPLKMVFTGSVTAATSPPIYLKSVQNLIEHFNSNFPKETLFVNTMGWVQGIGEVCFQSVKKVVKPTVLIDFLPTEECPDLKIEKLPDQTVCIQVPTKEYSSSPSFSPKDLRNFALLSYFGKCQKYYMQPTYLNAFRPACVCWDNVAIFVIGKKVPPNRLIEAIHCSVVALCHVDESFMLESDKAEFPRTLVDEPPNDCLGFGIVRAADEATHLLYIVTPLSLDDLYKVNTLIKGNVMIPDELFLKQPIPNVPLPYTDQSRTAPVYCRKVVKKRSFRKSITQTPG